MRLLIILIDQIRKSYLKLSLQKTEQNSLHIQIQFSMLNILSRQQDNPSPNLSYVVPFQCWNHIVTLNSQFQTCKDLLIPQSLSIDSQIEPIHPKDQSTFINLAQQKTNFLQIDHFIFNPKLKNATKWKTVSKKFLDLLKNNTTPNINLPFMYLEDIHRRQNQLIQIDGNQKYQIIKLLICSYTQNHLIYGYISQKANIKIVIKEIIAFFQYFQTEHTKITFLESNQFLNFKFQHFIEQLDPQDGLILVHGLGRYDQKLQDQVQRNDVREFEISAYEIPGFNQNSRNEEELTMADQDSRTISEHTMSTGAETPINFTVEVQDWDELRPYGIYAVFGQKLEEEIDHMKQYAREAIYMEMIKVPVCGAQLMIKELEKLAEDIEQNIEKKKIHQKEMAKDSKEYLKELYEMHHSLHSKDNTGPSVEARDYLWRRIQNQNKLKESQKSLVYFSLGGQNN